MHKPIDRAVAKGQLERINRVLQEPHLLIGGLAVGQFYVGRDSKDIDLVCQSDTALELIQKLYPSRDWTIDDKLGDEYRPSYQITHNVDDLGTIIFGPKISEREPYDHINWDALKRDAKPFRTVNGLLENILVPPAHALAYTKFISFLGRKSPAQKIEADLKDLVNLTNNKDFVVSHFFDLLRKTKSCGELCSEFRVKSAAHRSIVEESCLFDVSAMFTPVRVSILDSPITVWVIGSTRNLPEEHSAWAYKVADALADAFVDRGYRVIMGRNQLGAALFGRRAA